MSKRSSLPVKKRPAPRRRSRPPSHRAQRRRPTHRRRYRLAMFVARKVEEHARLARDASRIAIAIALGAILFLLVGAISRTITSERIPALLSPAAAPANSAPAP